MSSEILQHQGCREGFKRVPTKRVIRPQGILHVARRASIHRKRHEPEGGGVGLKQASVSGVRLSLVILAPQRRGARRIDNTVRLVVRGSFENLGIGPSLSRAAKGEAWLEPTDIQRRAIPAVLNGADVWAEAPTGSGNALPLTPGRLIFPGGM
jgi:hypothetical protein